MADETTNPAINAGNANLAHAVLALSESHRAVEKSLDSLIAEIRANTSSKDADIDRLAESVSKLLGVLQYRLDQDAADRRHQADAAEARASRWSNWIELAMKSQAVQIVLIAVALFFATQLGVRVDLFGFGPNPAPPSTPSTTGASLP